MEEFIEIFTVMFPIVWDGENWGEISNGRRWLRSQRNIMAFHGESRNVLDVSCSAPKGFFGEDENYKPWKFP